MKHDFTIANLGSGQINSSLSISSFTSDDDRILFHTRLNNYSEMKDPCKQKRPLSHAAGSAPASMM
jgi:hypothetical protein